MPIELEDSNISVSHSLFCVVVMAALQPFLNVFAYQKAVLAVQPWRLFTGHWVHVGWAHFLLNTLALLILPYALPIPKRFFWLIVGLVPLLLSLCFIFLHPHMEGYAGFSGVLHGLYLGAALLLIRQNIRDYFAWLILVGIIIKVSSEQFGFHSVTASLIGAAVMVDAHLYGCFFGILLSVVFYHNQIKE